MLEHLCFVQSACSPTPKTCCPALLPQPLPPTSGPPCCGVVHSAATQRAPNTTLTLLACLSRSSRSRQAASLSRWMQRVL